MYSLNIAISACASVSPPFSYRHAEYFMRGPNMPLSTLVPTS